MSDIFISYAKEDRERARLLAAALEDLGWSVFWDRTIPPGLTWHDYIGREIQEARCVLVAWSEAAIQSGWVLEEAGDARKRGVLIPFFFDEVEPPLGFRSLQAADLSRWSGDAEATAFQQLVQGMHRLLGSPPIRETEVEGPREEQLVQPEAEPTVDAQKRDLEEDANRQAEEEKQRPTHAKQGTPSLATARFLRSAPGLALTGVVLVAVVLSLLYFFRGRELTISKTGTGGGTVTSDPPGIDCGVDCSEDYAYNTVVVLDPTPDACSTFAGWSGDAECSGGRFTMNAARSCNANFEVSSSVRLVPGSVVRLKSWKDDYLHPEGSRVVTSDTLPLVPLDNWTVEDAGDGKIRLKSSEDHLHLTRKDDGTVVTYDSSPGVPGSDWTVELTDDCKIRLKSSKDDYLHRRDDGTIVTFYSGPGVPGSVWTVEQER